MAAYLVENPPARSQYRRPRRQRPSGVIVVHTAENTPDFVAFDGGAEAVARFIRGRSDPGSYHDLADSDSCINLVPYDAEAYHDGTGSNPHSYGVSVATRADVWPLAPQRWRDGAVAQAAAAARRYAAWVKAHHGIVIPPRRINRAQSEHRVPGFLSHAERDPARRTDPGAAFPWDQFLDLYADQEDDMDIADLRKELTTGGTPTRTEIRALAKMGAEDAAKDEDGVIGLLAQQRLEMIMGAAVAKVLGEGGVAREALKSAVREVRDEDAAPSLPDDTPDS